ncbi:MAG TPA: hypothetical protein VMM79_13755 [Longimicrobiales bacterium]|nr:hypothetical protein [Longimicrobiales bacterium]
MVMLSSCQDDPTPEPMTAAVRDSAGISIVESVAPRWGGGWEWRLSSQPVVQLGGGIDGDPNHHFANIRAVRLLQDSVLMVADAGTYSLSFFDLDGALLQRSGGEGSGPGELGGGLMQRVIFCPGDSTFVAGRGRLTVFGPSGVYERTVTMNLPPGQSAAPGWCTDRHIVALMQYSRFHTEPGLYRDSTLLGFYSKDGDFVETLGPFPYQDRTFSRGVEGVGYHPTPFGRTLAIAATDGRLAMGIGDIFEIRLHDSIGNLTTVARILEDGQPLTRTQIDRYRGYVFGDFRGNPTERRNLEAELDGSDLPSTVPAFAELLFDNTGNLWVRRHDHYDAISFFNYALVPGRREISTRTMPAEARTWSVVDSAGTYLGDVATPPGFLVHQIGDDWVLGIWRDQLDVEHVQLYDLLKPTR